MNKTRSIIGLLLSALLVFSLLPSPALAASGYTVSLETQELVNVGESFFVQIDISSDTEPTYNSAYLVLTYDASIFAFQETDFGVYNTIDFGVEIIEQGKLVFSRFGKDISTARPGDLDLEFKALAAGETGVFAIESAKVDRADHAAFADAPDATIGDACAVTVASSTQPGSLDVTVSASASAASVYAGETFTIDLFLNGTPESEAPAYASVVLQEPKRLPNSAYLSFSSDIAGAKVTEGGSANDKTAAFSYEGQDGLQFNSDGQLKLGTLTYEAVQQGTLKEGITLNITNPKAKYGAEDEYSSLTIVGQQSIHVNVELKPYTISLQSNIENAVELGATTLSALAQNNRFYGYHLSFIPNITNDEYEITSVTATNNGNAIQVYSVEGMYFINTQTNEEIHAVVFVELSKKTYSVEVIQTEGGNLEAVVENGTVSYIISPDQGYCVRNAEYSYDGTDWYSLSVPVGSAEEVTGTFKLQKSGTTWMRASFFRADSVLHITTEAELRQIAENVNTGADTYFGKTISLDSDISLKSAWEPIGSPWTRDEYEDSYFQGTFLGNGHSISGLEISSEFHGVLSDKTLYVGLFGRLENAVIDGVSVSGAILLPEDFDGSTSDGYRRSIYCGGIAGAAYDSVISNCNNHVVIKTRNSWIGGIVGEATGRIEKCANYAELSCHYNCSKTADRAQSQWAMNAAMGGIAGVFGGWELGSVMESCVNYGKLTSGNDTVFWGIDYNDSYTFYDYAQGNVGGLVATMFSAEIYNSCNKGDIAGKAKVFAGLVGYIHRGYSAIVANCYNSGSIRVENYAMRNNGSLHVSELIPNGIVLDVGHLDIKNCYASGTVTILYPENTGITYDKVCGRNFGGTYQNIFGLDESEKITVENLGNSFKDDIGNINGGFPLLFWELEEIGEPQSVTIEVEPTDAEVHVYRDSSMTKEIGDYSILPYGKYYYRASKDGFGTETGSFSVLYSPVTVRINLRAVSVIRFVLSPEDAELEVVDSNGNVVAPNADGTFTLYTGLTYTYSVTASGYNGVTHDYPVNGDATVTVTLTASNRPPEETDDYIYGDGNVGKECHITAGGTYYIGDGATGVLTISTTESVTLIGSGISTSARFEDLYIDCEYAGTHLTLQDVYISNTAGRSDPKMTNMIDFTGSGNVLTFAGVSILDQNTNATGYALIHVNESTSLTVTGGVGYVYKREQGAGIGGNGGASGGEGQPYENNGEITFDNALLFMKSTKQGALIGSGAQASRAESEPGSIIIRNSELNLIANARGAAIGGSAGSRAAGGTNVYVTNSLITINVDYSGAAIGGGGFDANNVGAFTNGIANDSDGGILHYTSGSIRAFIDTNAVTAWDVPGSGVNGNKAITARVQNNSGEMLHLLVFNTDKINGSTYTVREGNTIIYSGSRHQYRYINEDTDKYGQTNINYTIDNWTALDDSNLYLYLTGEDHELTVNGEAYTVTWNADTETFTVKDASGSTVNPGSDGGTVEESSVIIDSETKVTDGTAVVSAKDKAVQDSIKAAEEIGADTLILQADENARSAGSTAFELPVSSAGDIGDKGLNLRMEASDGSVLILDSEVLKSIAAQAEGETLRIVITTKTRQQAAEAIEQAKLSPAELDNSAIFEVKILSGNKEITEFDGRLTLDLPAGTAFEAGKQYRVIQVSGGGTVEEKSGVCVLVDGKLCVELTATHLSTFIVLNREGLPFTDIDGHWAYDAIAYAYYHGLFKGTSETTFEPQTTMSRAMLVTVLHRMEGEPKPASETSVFEDVPEGTWYTEGVTWAAEMGIVEGYGDGKFGPTDDVTREQMAAILYRYSVWKGYDVSKASDLAAYEDKDEVHDWAMTAMRWANAEGLIIGRTETTLVPRGNATRAEVATILMRYLESVAK